MMRSNIAQMHISQLLFIDIQSKLAAVMPQEPLGAMVKNCTILAAAAKQLHVPILLTEQYPKGLGATVPEILACLTDLPETKPIAKTAFSCLREPAFKRQLTRDHSQIIIAGMEAHICVVQTAMDLLDQGKQVFVVEDAVISRNPANKANAIARMREAGCIVSNTESVVFEWLGGADAEAFKAISQLIR
jgi:nicotinamidase-related amidase